MMKLQKQDLSPVRPSTSMVNIQFERRRVPLQLTNETDSLDETLALANAIVDALSVYEGRARSVLMDSHVALEAGQKVVLSGVDIGEDTYVSFAYTLTDGSGLPLHTFFVSSFDKGQSFEA